MQAQLVQLQRDLEDAETRHRNAIRLRDLLQVPAFHELAQDLQAVANRSVRRIISERLDMREYDEQRGYIRALRLFADTKPMSRDELSQIQDETIPDLRRKIAEVTNLLGPATQDSHGRQEDGHEGE